MTDPTDLEVFQSLLGPGSRRGRAIGRGMATALPMLRRVAAGSDTPDREALADYVQKMRPSLDRLAQRGPTVPGTRISPLVGTPTPGEWVSTSRSEDHRVVLYLHGGAYVVCSPATHRGLTRGVAHAGHARSFVPEYRLAPEHPYPAALDDAVASYRWLVSDGGIDPSDIVVAGDSAGGGLALAMLVALRDAGDVLPAGYVGISPWTDLAITGASIAGNNGRDAMFGAVDASTPGVLASLYYGDVDPLDPYVSPLYADLSGLPPMLVHVGANEILLDDARRLVDRARDAGVQASLGAFGGMWHVFQAFPIPEAKRSLREIGGFIRRVTGDRAGG